MVQRGGGEGALVEWRGEAARWSMWDTQGAATCIAPEHISGTQVLFYLNTQVLENLTTKIHE